MTERQLIQLVSAASAVHATLDFQQKQIATFTKTIELQIATITTTLDEIQNSLTTIAANPPPHSKSDLELLAKTKANISSVERDINNQLDKPILQFQKELEKIQAKIAEKFSSKLRNNGAKNLEPVLKIVTKCQDIIKIITSNLQYCLQSTSTCRQLCIKVAAEHARLNLPNKIASATKVVVKATTDLNELKNNLTTNPGGLDAYQQQFLPFYDALECLRIECDSMKETANTAPKNKPV